MTAHFTYDDALAAIWERSVYDRGFISNPFAGDEAARLGLMRTAGVLIRLGNPERQYWIVHVAGSKGKGSTTVTIDAILRQTGLKVGRFISPHLHTYRERIVVQNRQISEVDFASITAETLAATIALETELPHLGGVTAWELSTAMALCWFARAGCDLAVIEVGLGGTLDATNVVDPVISVITRLDFEHTAILGNTLTEIAGNKAGIIKPGKPVVSADQPAEALAVIEARVKSTGSRLLLANRDFSVAGSDSDFTFEDPNGRIAGLRTILAGAHQVENAALAIATARAVANPADEQMRAGLLDVVHPGRFEEVRIDDRTLVVIDGAHSPVAATALVQAVRDHYPGAHPLMIVGMLQDKDATLFVSILANIASGWIVASPASPRALPAPMLAESIETGGPVPRIIPGVAAAIAAAIASYPPLVVVTGSLTTAAEARVALGLAVNDPVPAAARAAAPAVAGEM